MSESFEISTTSAKRILTDSAFGMNLVPSEFSGGECWYEHPRLGAKIEFYGKWVFEKRIVPMGDREIERSVGLGLIVIRDQLLRLITQAIEKSGQEADGQALVLDCYELVVSFLLARNERGSFPDQPHIYQITVEDYGRLGSSAEVRPEILEEIRAIEVY